MVSGAERSRSTGVRRLFFAGALLVYGLYALRYIWAASVVEEGQRWFLLWDDAMISMQYARNLAQGEGWVWNAGGPPVQGFTNFGITLYMALLHAVAIPLPYVSLAFQLTNLAVLIGILLGIHRLGRLLFPAEPCVADGAAILTGLYGPLAIWGLQGSDFAIQAGIAVGALCVLFDAQRRGAPPPLSVFVILALGIVVRLDFAIVFGTVWLWSLLFAFPDGRKALPGALVGAATLLALAVFGLVYFGDPLPNTFYLKASGNPKLSMIATGWKQFLSFYPGFFKAILVLFVVYTALLLARDRHRGVLLLTVLILGQVAYYVWVGGDWVVEHTSRYLMVAMPLAILLLAAGAAAFLGFFSSARDLQLAGWRLVVFWAQLALFVWCLNPPDSIAEWHLATRDPMYKEENASNLHMASSLCEFTTPDTKVGIFWAGLTPYACSREYLDVLGRTNRHIARRQMDSFQGGPGHAKWDWAYVFEVEKPDVLTTFSPELVARDDFDRAYCAVRMPVPRIIIPVRKDSVDKILDHDRRLCGVKDFRRCVPCVR